MKNKTIHSFLAAGLLAITSGAASAAPAFGDGDLAVCFYSVTGSGAAAVFGTEYYVVNLGSGSLFRENSANDVAVKTINPALASSNIGADLADTFGSTWAEDGTVRWVVIGGVLDVSPITNGDPGRTLYLSNPRTSFGSGQLGPDPAPTQPFPTISSSNISGSTGQINQLLQNYTNQAINMTNGYTSVVLGNSSGVKLTTSNVHDLSEYVPPATLGLWFTLGTNPTQTFGSGKLPGSANLEGALDLFRVLRTTSGTGVDLTAGASSGNAVAGKGQFIGTLTLDSAGNLKIQAVGAAPAGSYATFAAANGITGGPTGDSDNDGITNLVEYALALNPAASDGAPGTFSGGTITFAKRPAAIANGDVSWVIETSTSLAAGSWTAAVTQPAGDPAANISYALPTGGPKNFARLRVVTTP